MTARKKIVFTLIVFTSIILFLFLLGKGLSAKELSQLITSNSLIGQKAPPFSLMTPEKTKIPLSNYEEKIVILNFWNPNCIECRIEASLLQQTSLTYYKFRGIPSNSEQMKVLQLSFFKCVFVQKTLNRNQLNIHILWTIL